MGILTLIQEPADASCIQSDFSMNSTAIHNTKQLHLAIAQSSVATAAVIAAAFPICSLLAFSSFVLRARHAAG